MDAGRFKDFFSSDCPLKAINQSMLLRFPGCFQDFSGSNGINKEFRNKRSARIVCLFYNPFELKKRIQRSKIGGLLERTIGGGGGILKTSSGFFLFLFRIRDLLRAGGRDHSGWVDGAGSVRSGCGREHGALRSTARPPREAHAHRRHHRHRMETREHHTLRLSNTK